MKKIAILGASGSIGKQAIDILKTVNHNFKLSFISVHSNISALKDIINYFNPDFAVVTDEESFKIIGRKYNQTKIYPAKDLINLIIENKVDIVLNAMYSMSGLLPTYTILNEGRKLALANKESLVSAGEIMIDLVNKKKSKILPVDSEHSAIWQCTEKNNRIKKIILTASGGPFFNLDKEIISKKKAKDALKHPNWSMGSKITIDSATLINKGLEKMEAKWLFGISDIEIVIHPQSIIHSMVEYYDSGVIAQLGLPDMRLPISYAIFEEERKKTNWPSIDFVKISKLEFFKADRDKFPGLMLAEKAMEIGGSMPLVFNTLNEIMVERYIKNKISFYEITDMIEINMMNHRLIKKPSIYDLLDLEKEIRDNLKENN